MGIGKTLNKKLEEANYYGLRTIMNMGKSTDYETILKMFQVKWSRLCSQFIQTPSYTI